MLDFFACTGKQLVQLVDHHYHHHHHRDAKRSAGASRRCGRSCASSRASVAVTPVSRQIWWFQVVDGRPQAHLHSCEGRSPSLVLVQICRIWFASTSRRRRRAQRDPAFAYGRYSETSNRLVRRRTSSLNTKSCQL